MGACARRRQPRDPIDVRTERPSVPVDDGVGSRRRAQSQPAPRPAARLRRVRVAEVADAQHRQAMNRRTEKGGAKRRPHTSELANRELRTAPAYAKASAGPP